MKAKGSRAGKAAADSVLEGHVRDVTDAGDAVVETERGIVMARGGLPAERVRVRVEAARAGVLRGVVLAVLAASPDRVEPECGLAERCGGCPLMSLALDAQRRLKLERVGRAVASLAADGVEARLEELGPPLGYRRRARFAFKSLSGAVVLGYHAHASKQLIDVAACPVLEPALARALLALRASLGPALLGSGEIELSTLEAGQVHVSVRAEAAQPASSYRAAEALASTDPVVSVALRVGGGAPARFGRDARDAAQTASPLVANDGFTQVNAVVNARLRELVFELAGARSARVLELYAGQGNFTLGLAEHAASLIAIESNPASAEACRARLRANHYDHARVIASEVAAARLPERCDVIVLDPPRGGANELAQVAVRTRAQTIVYVSCHMTTLGRDLRALHAVGFEVDRVHALDMFPQTAHVEAVVRMRRIVS